MVKMGTIQCYLLNLYKETNCQMLSVESVSRYGNYQVSVESVPRDGNYQMVICGICTWRWELFNAISGICT
jgi:hypothetical protein